MNALQAELLGMHAGDGTLYKTKSKSLVWEQRGGLDEQDYYFMFVTPLLQELFKYPFKPKHRSGGGRGSFGIQSTHKPLTRFISRFFPIGEKSSRVRVPYLIFRSSSRVKCAFLRGVFDTDGCFRLDYNKRKNFYYHKIEFGSACRKFRDDIARLVRSLGLTCYTWNAGSGDFYSLCIPGKNNMKRWFYLISSHNPKHLNKVARWFRLQGAVPWKNRVPAQFATVAQPGTAQMR